MPKKVFIELEQKKKEEYVTSLFNVFSKYHYNDITINDITKELNITRTAFYYYFYNKEDVYGYLVELVRDKFINEYIYCADKQFDLEGIFIELFKFLAKYKGTKCQDFFLDLLYNISFGRQNLLLIKLVSRDKRKFSHFIGYDIYEMKTTKEINEIVYVMFEITSHEIISYYTQNIELNDSLNNLKRIFYLVDNGIKKEKK